MVKKVGFQEIKFSTHAAVKNEWTLADPADGIWSSINSLCAADLSEHLASNLYNVTSKKDLKKISKSIKVYIKQAYAFYQASKFATANTSPLMTYYSFLNLGKAACEFLSPGFHQTGENYNHGAIWRPSRDFVVDVYKENVLIPEHRGMWHSIWEVSCSDVFLGQGKKKSTPIPVKDLFMACPEISVEAVTVFGGGGYLISLIAPCFLQSEDGKYRKIKFSVNPSELKLKRVSIAKLLKQISCSGATYRVSRRDAENLIFESSQLSFVENDIACEFYRHLRQLRVFAEATGSREIKYSLCDQSRFPFPLSQLTVSYTILFWLGSLVRYDPHSVDELTNSREWLLVQGFMSHSTLWLLQQFRWLIFRKEISIVRAW